MTAETATKKYRVYLVDDHPLVVEGLRQLLGADERLHVVGVAYSAEEAMQRLETLAADVVVMDVQLPGMDGIKAIGVIKSRHPQLKVVVVSSYGQEYLVPSIEAGADGYMLKTSAPPDLVKGILQAAEGEAPIDPSLTRQLLTRVTQPASRLSERQTEILRLLAAGSSSEDLVAHLFISPATLKRELRNIFNHMGVNDRTHAVAEAFRRHLV